MQLNRRTRHAQLGFSTIVMVLFSASWNLGAQERMPPIPPEKMTDAQKNAAHEYKAARGTDPSGPPWSVLLRDPEIMRLAFQTRLHLQFHSALDNRLTEFAIEIAARQWTNNWEWAAHATAATTAGLKPEILAAVAEGRRPDRMAQDEEALYDFCTELQRNQSVSDPTYAKALAKFGEEGIVEIATIQGYYTMLAMVMNAARVTVSPTTTKAPLERFPRLGQGLSGK